ncbi:DUF4870 family protein [Sphaerotilus sp.]|jgi:uncharacterized membrane protein|uniref:DUF4870 family protein n=1 Tax=Sphaerotilus sp. TaxID=2093942 RepID=UPI0025FC0C38|nr:hypothetical protein [Sphaerotilus sp.]
MNNVILQDDALRSSQRMLHIIYALHALGLGLGAFGAATVVGSFLFGWPSIIAVVLSYIERSKVANTWMSSHIDWVIRTFWIALAWSLLVLVVSVPLMALLIGFATLPLGMFLLGVWAIYRIARGWLRLKDGQAMPAE